MMNNWESNICIMEGQDVLLDKGYKIEEIWSGDTIDGSVIYKIFKQPSSESMVKLPKNCFEWIYLIRMCM